MFIIKNKKAKAAKENYNYVLIVVTEGKACSFKDIFLLFLKVNNNAELWIKDLTKTKENVTFESRIS